MSDEMYRRWNSDQHWMKCLACTTNFFTHFPYLWPPIQGFTCHSTSLFSFTHVKTKFSKSHSRLHRKEFRFNIFYLCYIYFSFLLFFSRKVQYLKSTKMHWNNKLYCSAAAASSYLWEFCYLHTINEKVSTASRYLNSLIKYGLLTALSYLF